MHGMVAGPTDRQTRTATAAALIESRLFCLSWWGRALPSLPPRRSLICPLNKVGRKTATRGEPVHFDKREQDGPLSLEMRDEHREEDGDGECEEEISVAPATFPRPTTLNRGRLLT